ncbi:MAG: MFS transporter, partial [Burkholderiaceae bacterium]|nr:MFS transporter [Burkholderiaceae bacterium]
MSMGAMMSSASLRICDAMLPALTSEFASSNKAVSATITSYALAYGFFQLFGAAIGERIGKVRMIALTCTIAGLVSAATALVSSLPGLVVLRAAAGIAFAGVIPLSIAV